LASGAALKLWSFPDLDSFIELTDYPSYLIASVAFSPDSRFLAAGMPAIRRGENIYGRRHLLRRLPLASWVYAVAFSPDSRFFAVAASNNVQIYRTSDWQFERVIFAFTQPTAMENGSSGKVLVARNPLITR
jgi:WD40 repeat protein